MIDVQAALAKKYAKAFISLNLTHITFEMAEHIKALGAYFRKHRRALFYVQLTTLDGDATRKNFDALFTAAGVDHIFSSLIDLLLLDGRIALLPLVLDFIYHFYLEKQGIMHFTIESAIPLADDAILKIQQFLEKRTGKKVIYRAIVNKDLIAGIKVYSDALGFEQSIRKQLRILSSLT